MAENDLRILLRQVDGAVPVRDALLDVLPNLGAIYGSAAATLAADFYDDLRDQAGVRGRFTAFPVEPAGPERMAILARWAVTPLFGPTPDKTIVLSKTLGAFQRVVTDAARYTITEASVADRRALGWRREGTGGCQFCRDRLGAEYRTQVSFDSHDACNCVAVPLFG